MSTKKTKKICHDNAYISHMTSAEAASLAVGQFVDHRDNVGRFVLSKITDKKGDNLKIHYWGWGRKWDCWCSYKANPHRFARAKSISRRPKHRLKDLKIGSYVDVNPLRDPGWRAAEIIRFDYHCDQVQAKYVMHGMHGTADLRKLCWVHLDNTQEIDSPGTHIEPQLHHLPIWLQTRHTLSNVSPQIKSQSMPEIAQIAFGGTSNMLDFMVENAKPSQLKKMQEIIEKNHIKHEELKKKQTDDVDVETETETEYTLPIISSMSDLPSDTISYLAAFLSKTDIKSFKVTSYKNCMVCLQEMRKCNVGILNSNKIINDTKETFVDIVGFGTIKSLNHERYPSSTPYRDMLQKQAESYDIPEKSQLLYRIVEHQLFQSMSAFCKFGRDTIVRHLYARDFFLLDKRHLIIYDKASDLFAAMGDNDSCIAKRTCEYKLVAIKWFDIYFQKLTIVQFMAINVTELTIARLLRYIGHEFIVTTAYQAKWHKSVMSYLQEMRQYSADETTLIVHKEAVVEDSIAGFSNATIEPIQNGDLSSKRKQRLILVFQLNPNHTLFARSRFATIGEKHMLLCADLSAKKSKML